MGTIRTTKLVTLDSIQPHPANINEGDVGAIVESLETHGQYRSIVVSEATMNILAGSHTYLAAQAIGWTKMSAHLLPDLTPEQELRIMLADNEYARKATYNDVSLSELLVKLHATDDALLGTGFDGDDLDQLLSDLDTSRFLPDDSEPPRLDMLQQVQCPSCGERFQASAHVAQD